MAKLEADMAIARKAAWQKTAEAKAEKETAAALAALEKTAASVAKSRGRGNGGSTGRRGSSGTNYGRESMERESGGRNRGTGKRWYQTRTGKQKRQRAWGHLAYSISQVGFRHTFNGPTQNPSRNEKTT